MMKPNRPERARSPVGVLFLVGLVVALMLLIPARLAIAASTPMIASVSPDEIRLTGHINVIFDGLDKSGLDPTTLRLTLNEHRFADIVPMICGPNEIRFELSKLRKDSEGWLSLAGSPPLAGVKPIFLAIGASGMELRAQNGLAKEVQWRVFDPTSLVIAALTFVFIIGCVVYLGVKYTIFRDTAGGLTVNSIPPAPYSLAKCQMAFWFAMILGGFLGLWVATGDFNNIVSAQKLTLLGISSVTALGAVNIDITQERARQEAQGQEEQRSKTDKTAEMTAPTETTPKKDRRCPGHLGFFEDILTDDTGWVFHRVEIFVWTIILGGVSLWSAYSKLTLPTFDQNLLILMGISSGLYLGLKYPEQQTRTQLPN